MGALVTRALRPIKSFNIENRAHREIAKEKPTLAPKYPSNIKDLERAMIVEPELDKKIITKDAELDNRLKDIYVTSYGRPEDDVTREKRHQNPNRPLPKDRKQVEDYDFGFKEPEHVTYGRTTLRNAVNFITAHQANPKEVTAEKIAQEYKLKEEDVHNILKYFKTYEIYLPETKKTPAVFAGPATLRKHLYKMDNVNFIEDKNSDKPKDLKELLEKIEMQNKNS